MLHNKSHLWYKAINGFYICLKIWNDSKLHLLTDTAMKLSFEKLALCSCLKNNTVGITQICIHQDIPMHIKYIQISQSLVRCKGKTRLLWSIMKADEFLEEKIYLE